MKEKTRERINVDKNTITLFGLMIAVIIIYQLLNKYYLSPDNIMVLLNSTSVCGTLAIGLTFLLISGQIDLSPASVGCVCGILITLMLGDGVTGISWPLALLLTIALGALSGLLVSFLVHVLNISAFIVTIAMSSIYQGLSRQFSSNMTLPVRNQGYWRLGASVGVVPMPFLIMVVLFVIYGVILARTKFGRKVYICGGNPNAARLAGINPKKIQTILFINNGALAALAGALLTARMRSAGFGSVLGNEIDAITAIVLGGVAFTGGKGHMTGSFVGLMLLGCVKNGLIGLGVPSYGQIIMQGAILIIALAVNFIREKSFAKKLKARI